MPARHPLSLAGGPIGILQESVLSLTIVIRTLESSSDPVGERCPEDVVGKASADPSSIIEDIDAWCRRADRIGMATIQKNEVAANLIAVRVGLDARIEGREGVLDDGDAQGIIPDHAVVAEHHAVAPNVKDSSSGRELPYWVVAVGRDGIGKVVLNHQISLDPDVVCERYGKPWKHHNKDPRGIAAQNIVPHDGVG